MKKYGLFIGRFQPFHLGHQAVINEILLDGRIPIIVYGSSNDKRDVNKNPLSPIQRMVLVDTIYSGMNIIHVTSNDYSSWDLWYEQLTDNIKIGFVQSTIFRDPEIPLQEDIVLYYTNKEVDRCDFECLGKKYESTWYTEIFKDQGFEMKESSFNMHPDLKIHANARDIRANLEENKHLLDARVYHRLKAWGWK